MHATSAEQPWDFSHVLGLINSLSHNPTDHSAATQPSEKKRDGSQIRCRGPQQISRNESIEAQDFAPPNQGLGDFSRIYQYLGTPLSSPAPAVQPAEAIPTSSRTNEFPTKEDYASDGATYVKPTPASGSKNVTWDDFASAEEPTTGDASDTSVVPDSPTLTKSQRKKRNRRERKAAEAAAAAKAATVSESEADVVGRQKTPANKASAHVTPKARYDIRPRDSAGKVLQVPKSALTESNDLSASVQTAVERLEQAKRANAEAAVTDSDGTPSKAPRSGRKLARTTSEPSTVALDARPVRPQQQTQSNISIWPMTPSGKQAIQLIPSSVQPLPQRTAANAVQTPQAKGTVQQRTATPKQPRTIEPLIVRSGEDRHWALFMKLINDFWQDRSYLIRPMNLTTHNNHPKGIHVFVDASNIFIGFKDQLKHSRGIPPYVHVPSVDLSFDALALLMERRRPVAKRVLAGSNPYITAFDEAKAVGYECSILEKVYKARELTQRQIYFKELDHQLRRKGTKAPPANNVATVTGGNGSGSETNAPQYAKPALIEQGVDEILHMKILESIVDYQEPATIVLATGDAAQAEYSDGFMAQAERALKNGWTVELVSWSKNISAMYTRKAWTDTWGERFKIIFLDDYAEELLAM